MARHAPAGVRRQQILDAALECFSAKGFHAARMDDIVHASGLSKGALYWHFKSKDEIFLGLFDRYEELIWQGWDALAGEPPVARLKRQGEVVLETLMASRVLLDAWVQFLHHPQVRERFARIYRESRRRLAAVLAEAAAAGDIRTLDGDHVAAAYTALVEGLVLQALVDPSWDPLAAWPDAWTCFSEGLLRPGG